MNLRKKKKVGAHLIHCPTAGNNRSKLELNVLGVVGDKCRVLWIRRTVRTVINARDVCYGF